MNILPTITIVTISYNSSEYICETIESVLSQSFADFEYLISDDKSSDNTWKIIQKYKDPRINAWQNKTNLGEYANRNKTLQEAKGKYIIWIDGDDILYPHGLEFMQTMLEAFPQSAMACARPYWPNMVYPYESSPKETYLFDYFGSPVTVNGFPDTLFKTESLREAGGLPTDYISGDIFIKKKIALTHPILLISNGVSWWRMTPGQASSKVRGSISGVFENLKIKDYFLDHPNCPLSTEEKAIAKSNIYSLFFGHLIRMTILKGKFVQFIHYTKKLNIGFSAIVKYTFTSVKLNYPDSIGISASNPLMTNFERNPFVK